jgi:hypothetical protein
MPLVSCPDCRKQVSDAAPACIHCGRPHPGRAGELAPDKLFLHAGSSRSSSQPQCPKCGSVDLKTLGMVHASGVSSVTSLTSIVGVNEGGLGVASASTSGRQLTALAQAAAPPTLQEADLGQSFALGCSGGCVLSLLALAAAGAAAMMWTWGIGTILLAMLIHSVRGWNADDHNTNIYYPGKERWDRSLMCMRCGTITDSSPPED